MLARVGAPKRARGAAARTTALLVVPSRAWSVLQPHAATPARRAEWARENSDRPARRPSRCSQAVRSSRDCAVTATASTRIPESNTLGWTSRPYAAGLQEKRGLRRSSARQTASSMPDAAVARSTVAVKQYLGRSRGSLVVAVVPTWSVLLDCAVRPRLVAMRSGRGAPRRGCHLRAGGRFDDASRDRSARSAASDAAVTRLWIAYRQGSRPSWGALDVFGEPYPAQAPLVNEKVPIYRENQVPEEGLEPPTRGL